MKPMVRRWLLLPMAICALWWSAEPAAWAQVEQPQAPQKLVVGTYEIAPFMVKRDDGSWTGISIEMWRRVAQDLALDFEIREYQRSNWVKDARGNVDVFVSMNISEAAERDWDMTHAFYSTGVGIATRTEPKPTLTVLREVATSSAFVRAFLAVTAIIFVMGASMWALERRKNEEEFGGWRGLLSGVFWAIETLIGYNDPTHRTRWGRAFGIGWAIACAVAISGFTAEMSSVLTANRMQTTVSGARDLPRVHVGTVERSQGAKWLKARGIAHTTYATPADLVEALRRSEVDAIVHEAPILQYHLRLAGAPELTLLPGTFDPHGYGFGLRSGSPLRERVDQAVLRISQSSELDSILAEWLGSD